MLKKYQVAETINDTFIVVLTCSEVVENNEIIGNLESISFEEFPTAAEAQELADELNAEQ